MYGTLLARILDPTRNLWWIWPAARGDEDWQARGDDTGDDVDAWAGGEADTGDWDRDSQDLSSIHESLMRTMRSLANPRAT